MKSLLRRFTLLGAIAGIVFPALAEVAPKNPVSVQLEASLNLVDLIKEVAEWIRGGINRFDTTTEKRVRESVPRLVVQLTTLSAKKAQLAEFLKRYDSGKTDRRVFQNHYSRKVRDLNTELRATLDTVKDLDITWSSEHPNIRFLVESVLRGKADRLFVDGYSLGVLYYESTISVSDLKRIIDAYSVKSTRLLNLANDMSDTLGEVSLMHNRVAGGV